MTKSNKYENAKNKLKGEINEVAGKITGNEQLELKGKIQSAKADFKKNTNVKKKVHEIKEDFAEKINDMMDNKKGK